MNNEKATLLEKAESLLLEDTKKIKVPVHKRVAYIVSHGASYASNGYAIRTQTVAKGLQEAGFEIVCFVKPGRPWVLDEQIDISIEETIDKVRYVHSEKHRSYVFSSADEELERNVEYYLKMFKIYRPEIILAASDYKVGLPSLIAARILDIPFINEVRGFWELTRLSKNQCYMDSEEYFQQIEIDTYVAKNSDKVLTLNNQMKSYLEQRGVESNNIKLLPNSVNKLPPVELKKRKVKSDQFTIGFIGSTNEYEGISDLIDACQLLNDEGYEVKLLIVGSSKAYKNKAETTKTKFSWLEEVGRVGHCEVPAYYAAIDLIVIPRRNERVCNIVPPLKIVEALSYNKNVVAADIPPLAEYASDFDSITLFKSGDVLDLKNTIKSAFKNQKSIKRKKLLTTSNINEAIDVLNSYIKKTTSKTITADAQKLPELQFTRQTAIFSILLDCENINSKSLDYFLSLVDVEQNKRLRISISATNVKDPQLIKRFQNLGILNTGLADNLQIKNSSYDIVITNNRNGRIPEDDSYELDSGLGIFESVISLAKNVSRNKILYVVNTDDSNLSAGYHKRSLHLAEGFLDNEITIPLVSLKSKKFGIRNNINFIPKESKLLRRIIEWLQPATIIAASNHENARPFLELKDSLSFDFVYEMRGLWHETYAAKMLEKNKNYNISGDKYYLQELREELKTVTQSDKIVFICEEMKAYVENKLGRTISNYAVVGNGFKIDKSRPRETKPIKTADLLTIGYFGAITYYEGITFLLDAVYDLVSQGYNIRVLLLGKNSIKEKWVLDLSKYDFVEFGGFVNNIDEQYEKIDLFVIPRLPYSVCHNVEPLKPFDCFSRQVPLLVSDCDALKRLAADGERAMLFRAGDKQSLKDAIVDLYTSGYPEEMLKRARLWVENNTSWSDLTSKYSKLVQKQKKKIYYLYADKWCVSYKWSGASINTINEMAVMIEDNDVYYNNIYVNDLFEDGLFDEQAFVDRFNSTPSSKFKRSKFLKNVYIPDKVYDICFFRSSDEEKYIQFFKHELPEPKVFSHNYVKSIWERYVVGFQTESSYNFAGQLKLKDFDDDGTLGYRNCNMIPRAGFIRYQSSVQNANNGIVYDESLEFRKSLNSEFVIGVIGTIYEGTNPNLLIEAVSELRKIYPQKNITLVIYTINVLIELPKEDWIIISNFSKDKKFSSLSQLDIMVNTWNSTAQLYSGSNKNIDAIEHEIPLIAAKTPAYEEQLGEDYPLFYKFDSKVSVSKISIVSSFKSLIEKCFDEDFLLDVRSYLRWRKTYISKEASSFLYAKQISALCEKHVLIVTQNLGVGGVQKYTRQLVKSLPTCKITILIDDEVSRSDYTQFGYGSRSIKIESLANFDKLDLYRFDTVFLNSYPVDEARLENILSKLDVAGCRVFPILHSDIHPFTVAISRFLSKVNKLITINRKIIDKLKFNCHTDFSRDFYHITPSLDDFDFSTSLPKTERTKKIAFFGRIARLKCVDFLCEAFCEYSLNYNSDYELHICGPLAHKGLDKVIDLCNKKAGKKIIYLHDKEFSATERMELFSSIDALIYTTATEGLPYTFLEANANGVPVISTNVGAVSTLVKDGINGFLIDLKGLYLENLYEEKPYNRLAEIMKENKESYIETFSSTLHKFEFGEVSLDELSFNSIYLAKENFLFDKMRNAFREVVYSKDSK
ncbi:glycosyltransferase [Salinimonas sp. HHU 13199]|uniref:Glycosyltransferase n=1 Tax=Salinimonas profundi TaxID=2729140 RepID=A0ABR8LNG8_9ALTE|nr:glycosyltransferase family 4 protein [Salinimonas profundi]MBD3587123.1 glycosyltransferase [Salinimonas profundi]